MKKLILLGTLLSCFQSFANTKQKQAADTIFNKLVNNGSCLKSSYLSPDKYKLRNNGALYLYPCEVNDLRNIHVAIAVTNQNRAALLKINKNNRERGVNYRDIYILNHKIERRGTVYTIHSRGDCNHSVKIRVSINSKNKIAYKDLGPSDRKCR